MFLLGYRFRKVDSLPRNLWRRERKRATLFESPLPRDMDGFHQRMVRLVGPEAKDAVRFLEDRDIARCVVEETWKMGDYDGEKKIPLREVFARLASTPTRRCQTDSSVARRRLRFDRREKESVLPEKIVDCLLGLHDTVHLRDGWFEYDECMICEKVREGKQKKIIACDAFVKLEVVERLPDVVW